MLKNRHQQVTPAPLSGDLEVYRLRKGSDELVIAAVSRLAALVAWGARENLFAQGEARVLVNDRATIAVAMAHPGVVLRRRAGAGGRFRKVRLV